MPHVQDHNQDVSILDMVYMRLRGIITKNAETDSDISVYTLELMNELEVCLKKDKDLPEGQPTKVGHEENYTIAEQSLIADMVSISMLQNLALQASQSASEGGSTTGLFLKKAKAGSADVEYEQFDNRKGGGFSMSIGTVIGNLKKSAIRKGTKLGCALIYTEEGGWEISCSDCLKPIPTPFIVTSKYQC